MNLTEVTELLTRTPAALDALLRGLPESWIHRNEGPDTWSAFDIIGHLIHGERTDWIPRAHIILESGESKPFEKFDRLAQMRDNSGKTLPQLLDELAHARRESLNELKAMNLQDADLQKRGRHPSLGTVTLGQLLAAWPAHDLTHIHQLSRVMAVQYRKDVGPWSRYMGVMLCQGHSS